MFPPDDATRFKMSSAIVWLLRVATVLVLSFLVIPIIGVMTDRNGVAIGILAASVVVCGVLSAYCWRAQARALNQFAVNETGIWRLPPKDEPLFIAWSDIGSVRADDTAQRLILSDRSGGRTLWLEYQLDDFSILRDYVLQHTTPASLVGAAGQSVFHRTWINKGVMALVSTPFLVFAVAAYPHDGPGLSLILLVVALLCLAPILGDPLSLSIETSGFVIHYPGWKRKIPFGEITSVTLNEENSNQGNVWAVVVIALKHRKPIKLYRFREGSLALRQALQDALSSASTGAVS